MHELILDIATGQKAVVWLPIAKATGQKAVVWLPIAKARCQGSANLLYGKIK